MTTPLVKYYETTIQDTPVGPDEAIAIITTDRMDRDGEVVVPSGIVLTNYEKNKIVMWGHAKGMPIEGEAGMPIAQNLWIRPTSDGHGLVARHKFDLADSFSERICRKVKNGFLNTYSITFIPIEFGPPTKAEIRDHPDWAKAKTIYRRSELVEYSVVARPANVDAVNIAKTGSKPMDEETPVEPVVEEQPFDAIVETAPEPAPEPDPVVDPVAKAKKPEPEPSEDEDVEEEEPIKAGQFVKCKGEHYKGFGKIKSVHKGEMVPDVEEDMMGSKEEPACKVKCYKAMGDGYMPTDHHKPVLAKHCETCDDLKAPTKAKAMPAPAPEPVVDPGWDEEQKALYKSARMASKDYRESVEKSVLDVYQTTVLGMV